MQKPPIRVQLGSMFSILFEHSVVFLLVAGGVAAWIILVLLFYAFPHKLRHLRHRIPLPRTRRRRSVRERLDDLASKQKELVFEQKKILAKLNNVSGKLSKLIIRIVVSNETILC